MDLDSVETNDFPAKSADRCRPAATSAVGYLTSDVRTPALRSRGYWRYSQYITRFDPTQMTLSGTVATAAGQPLPAVTVQIVPQGDGEADVTHTTPDGLYSLSGLVIGQAYTLSAALETTDPLQGVNSQDLYRLYRHVRGIERLSDPYRLIAADLDGSGRVEFADYLQLQALLLGKTSWPTGRPIWRFMDATHVFASPQNPWSDGLPEQIVLPKLPMEPAPADFVGIKIGDLDFSAAGNAFSGTALEHGISAPGPAAAAPAGLWLEQNSPNPVSFETTIGFVAPAPAEAVLTVRDATGRVVLLRGQPAVAGPNNFTLTRQELGTAGVLSYTVTVGDWTATRKMIVLR